MPFTFHGDTALTYVQYMDLEADRTLTAEPGGTYDMAPAGNWVLPVPPADGRWQPAGESDPPPAEAAAEQAADPPGEPDAFAAPPPHVTTGTGTAEDEEK